MATNVRDVDLATACTATWSTTAEALIEATLHATLHATAETATAAAAGGSTGAASSSNEARLGLTVLRLVLAC